MSKETHEERKDIATQEAADLGPVIGIKEKTKRDEEIQKGLQETDKTAKLITYLAIKLAFSPARVSFMGFSIRRLGRNT